jgi:hypothetical protein
MEWNGLGCPASTLEEGLSCLYVVGVLYQDDQGAGVGGTLHLLLTMRYRLSEISSPPLIHKRR